ncbi:amidohydrolase [Anaerobacillus arseniciselenatis]|uniref:Amidohydrolase n=1 Tax=Anaerobacillus arseniciselenatis TaxID=85682 RepID=A0A1S2LH77_9BACI|nr:amidohydrolase family protein [Anaerobacillus arseniciselenatis]OIJ11664.1 amidohydrolase [Anaerobacillus arseniciselenatis]
MNVNLLIKNAFVMTMEGKGVGMIENGAVAINGNMIEAVGGTEELTARYSADRVIDAKNKLVMPGLIDSHIHTGLSIVRGVSQDMNHWMQKGLWPFLKHVHEEDTVKGSLVNIIEGVKAGTTTFCDYDTSMNKLVENYVTVGARARVAEMVNEIPNDIGKIPVGELYPFDPTIGERKLQENITLMEKWHEKENGRITVMFGPHGPDMMSHELLLHTRELAIKYDTKLHMHLAQGDREIEQMVKRYGKRSVQFLQDINYLDDRLITVHLTEATDEETAIVAKSGASMIYCAGSIGIIDGLVPPVMQFIEAGGVAGLGSDQAPGNNNNNMFNEMKFAAILNKVKRSDPTVFPAPLALRLATIEAAKSIGLDHEVGSLKKGKKADVIIVDLQHPNLSPIITSPIRNIVPNLVYSARGNEVETVLIDGEVIVEEGKLLTVNEEKAVKEAQKVAHEISVRATDDIILAESDLLKMMEEGYL